jgi:hypothetical protein
MPDTVMDRLREWYQLAKTPFVYEDPAVLAGRQGEEQLRTMVDANIRYRGAESFVGKRIFSPANQRRREIDLIVVTANRLHLFEVKNWTGDLSANGRQWVHLKKSGERKVFSDLVVDNAEKQTLVLEYLARRGAALPRERVSPKLILINRKLRVDRAIASNPHVITAQKLERHLDTQKASSFGERLVCSVIEYCLSIEAAEMVVDGLFGNLHGDKYRRVVAAIRELNTWDQIVMNGTRVLSGDLIRINAGSRTFQRRAMRQGDQIDVNWNRRRFWGLLQAVTGARPLGTLVLPNGDTLPLSTRDSLFFHPAGQPKPMPIPLTYVDQITIG